MLIKEVIVTNKATKIVNNIFKYFMFDEDNDITGDFRIDNISDRHDDWELANVPDSCENLKDKVKTAYDSWGRADTLDPFGMQLYNQYQSYKKFAGNMIDKLMDYDDEDYFLLSKNNLKCRQFKVSDILWMASCLSDYLTDEMSPEFKIKWILSRSRLSNAKLAKRVGLYPQQIFYYKKGKRDIDKMTLKSAEKFERYYFAVISKKLAMPFLLYKFHSN